ncbi:DnaJ-domain-containing protein [Myriangium duriaei CBS 260.36]|uniref:Tetratricopeptide repeat and J domain-containing co-chaperone DNJ1 n=1 Tax=Myriangium duriaei CBS 260.36 TaxID=1168546 RepID=A0A9P4IU98_9PEZI|nr:DnaJ-domain-containing protein [Myriangium duriaei CBS 260.36]
MVFQVKRIALGVLAASAPLSLALSPSDIPADTPVAKLISSATALLAQGQAQDALTYFDVAVTRDPQNYLTLFRRGAAYLQLGKHSQASHDFDRVLAIKPTFEGALVQRGKIKSRNADWDAAKEDFRAAGKTGDEMRELEEAQGAEKVSADAEKAGDWGTCTANADVAINVASGALGLRQRRAHCRFEKGEIIEGLSDLLHVAQISSSEDAFLKLSATYFYALNEPENGLTHIRKCMHSDPDSKACRKLLKSEKATDKRLKKIRDMVSKRQYNSAVKQLIKTEDDAGLVEEVKTEAAALRKKGSIPATAPSHLYNSLVELTCEAYTEMNNLKKAQPWCDEALTHNPNCLPALIGKATREIDSDNFEEAIRTINAAKEAHSNNQKLNELHHKASTLLKRSKQKDYYKVLGVTRDADGREIKRAYRKLSKENHPDKATQKGITGDEAQKRMASINEAYEVLSDPELKTRFDNGDDPNDTSQQQGHPFQGSPFGFGGGGQPVFFQQGGGGGGRQQQFKFQGGGGGGFNFPGGFPF